MLFTCCCCCCCWQVIASAVRGAFIVLGVKGGKGTKVLGAGQYWGLQ